MSIPRIKILNSSISSVFVVLGFLVALNFLVSQKSLYLDLTQEKIYTTSQATKDILKNLEKDVSVNFYISKDLPVDLLNVKTQVVDLMNQYRDLGGSKLKISYNEPENNEETVKELAQKGIPQIQFNVVEKDKYEVKQGFFGVEIVLGEGDSSKRETIPMIESIDNLEYDFISSVYSVSKEKKELVAFLAGHGEKQLQIPDMGKSYDVKEAKIESEGEKKGFYYEKAGEKPAEKEGETETTMEKIFIEPITLIIAGPVEKITDGEISVIDDFINGGGNVIVLSESVSPNLQNMLEAQTVENDINKLIEKYGIKINSDLVYDASNSNITYRQGFFSLSRPYPFWVKTLPDNFGDHPALSGVQSVIFPWISSLSVSENEKYNARSIISSTSKANTVSGNYNLLPDAPLSFYSESQKTLAAFSRPKDENSKSGLLFVVGDSDFISPNFSSQLPDNETFFANLVDSVSNSANLASIRSKNISSRPIKELDESEKNYWKFVSIFAAAILVDIYGVFRIVRRKKKNK